MKTKLVLFVVAVILFSSSLQAQSMGVRQVQEVVLVGTMHTIPKIVKHNYKPMLKKAYKYKPEAIYVESPMPDDSISWSYLKNGWSRGYQRFYKLSDSLKNTFDFDVSKFESILQKDHADMTQSDLSYLITSFAYKRDNGNYEFYSYIKKYGVKGARRPTRHEDGDLTYKLALKLGLKQVVNMDDQRTNKEYHEGWQNCINEGRSNGNNEIINRLNKKDYNRSILPALFRRLGKHANKRKNLNLIHKLNSFRCVKMDTPGCVDARQYWDERNKRMADNIATQVIASGKKRNIVIVGAGHIIGLEEELKNNYPELQVRLMYE